MKQITKVEKAEQLVREFLSRVWGPNHEIDVIDALMTPDYIIHSGGKTVRGREVFKDWVAEFQRLMPEAIDEVLDLFSNESGTRVCARWINRGKNNGVFGLPPDGQPVAFHGISVWTVRDGKLAECHVERETPQRL